MRNIKSLVNIILLVISASWAVAAVAAPNDFRGGFGGGHVGPGRGHGGGAGGYMPPGQQPGWPPQRPPASPYPANPYPGQPSYGYDVKRIYIGRSVMNERLPLRQLGGIGRQYSGWEVVSVRVNTRPTNSGQTLMQLVSDGRIVASQYEMGYQTLLYPQYRLVLDQTANTLQLVIGGMPFIDNVEVELRQNGGYNPPPPPQPPPYGQNIEINLYRSVFGNDRLDLTQFIDMQRYRGRVIEQVMLTANARYGVGFIGLLVNGYNFGQAQINSGYSQNVTYRLNQPMVIGQGPSSVMLQTQGDMMIEHVTIVVR